MTELGNRLKEARETKGYSLDDLQRITKIQKRYLIGIEEGSYEMMPGKFYVRAFIKQYCEAVGLQPELIFDEYKEDIPKTYNDEIPIALSRVQSRKTVTESSPKVLDFLPKLFIALIIIGALIAVWVFVQGRAGDNADTKETDNQQQVAVDQKDPAPSENAGDQTEDKSKEKDKEKNTDKKSSDDEATDEEGQNSPKQSLEAVKQEGYKTTYELKNTDKFQLALTAKGDTWVGVYNSEDDSLFEGLLKNGDKQDFDLSSDEQAYLVIGNAANTDIVVNDSPLEYKLSTDVVRQDIIINHIPAASQQ